MIPEALLVFYAQAVHAHTRGTWTAIECVDMDRSRGAHNPYCLPSQMTVPIAAKWLLVHEDPLTGTITARSRHSARDRLAQGERIGVTDAPTRRGRIGFSLISRIDDGEIAASVDLAAPAHRSGCASARRNRSYCRSATMDGPERRPLPVEGDVLLPEGMSGRIDITTSWRRGTP